MSSSIVEPLISVLTDLGNSPDLRGTYPDIDAAFADLVTAVDAKLAATQKGPLPDLIPLSRIGAIRLATAIRAGGLDDDPDLGRKFDAVSELLLNVDRSERGVLEVAEVHAKGTAILDNLRSSRAIKLDTVVAESGDVEVRSVHIDRRGVSKSPRDQSQASAATFSIGSIISGRDVNLHDIVVQVTGVELAPNTLRNTTEAFLSYYLTMPFTGRTAVLDRLDSWLTGAESSPTLCVFGGAGSGKSALLSHWAVRLDLTRYDLLFIPMSGRFGTDRLSMMFEALSARLAELQSQILQHPVGSPDAHYRDVATGYLRNFQPRSGKRCVIIIDGLDEARDWTEGAYGFPASLSRHVKIVVSVRPQPRCDTPEEWLKRLGWHTPGFSTVLPVPPLTLSEVRDLVESAFPEFVRQAQETVAAELYRLSGGDALLLGFYVQDLAEEAKHDNDRALSKLGVNKPGLAQYMDEVLRPLINEGPESQRVPGPVLDATLALLSSAMGPIALSDLHVLLRLVVNEEHIPPRDRVVGALRRFVLTHAGTITLAHPRLDSLVADRLAGSSYLITAKVALHRWQSGLARDINSGRIAAVPRYALMYYGEHLRAAGNPRPEDLEQLVLPGWVASQRVTLGERFVAADARLVLDCSRQAPESGESSMMRVSLRAALILCSLTSRSVAIDPAVLVKAIAAQLIETSEAEAIASRQTDDRKAATFAYLAANAVDGARQTRYATAALDAFRKVTGNASGVLDTLPSGFLIDAATIWFETANGYYATSQRETIDSLFSRLEEAQFDHLIAVFSEKPDFQSIAYLSAARHAVNEEYIRFCAARALHLADHSGLLGVRLEASEILSPQTVEQEGIATLRSLITKGLNRVREDTLGPILQRVSAEKADPLLTEWIAALLAGLGSLTVLYRIGNLAALARLAPRSAAGRLARDLAVSRTLSGEEARQMWPVPEKNALDLTGVSRTRFQLNDLAEVVTLLDDDERQTAIELIGGSAAIIPQISGGDKAGLSPVEETELGNLASAQELRAILCALPQTAKQSAPASLSEAAVNSKEDLENILECQRAIGDTLQYWCARLRFRKSEATEYCRGDLVSCFRDAVSASNTGVGIGLLRLLATSVTADDIAELSAAIEEHRRSRREVVPGFDAYASVLASKNPTKIELIQAFATMEGKVEFSAMFTLLLRSAERVPLMTRVALLRYSDVLLRSVSRFLPAREVASAYITAARLAPIPLRWRLARKAWRIAYGGVPGGGGPLCAEVGDVLPFPLNWWARKLGWLRTQQRVPQTEGAVLQFSLTMSREITEVVDFIGAHPTRVPKWARQPLGTMLARIVSERPPDDVVEAACRALVRLGAVSGGEIGLAMKLTACVNENRLPAKLRAKLFAESFSAFSPDQRERLLKKLAPMSSYRLWSMSDLLVSMTDGTRPDALSMLCDLAPVIESFLPSKDVCIAIEDVRRLWP
jgi:hypothetical protein